MSEAQNTTKQKENLLPVNSGSSPSPSPHPLQNVSSSSSSPTWRRIARHKFWRKGIVVGVLCGVVYGTILAVKPHLVNRKDRMDAFLVGLVGATYSYGGTLTVRDALVHIIEKTFSVRLSFIWRFLLYGISKQVWMKILGPILMSTFHFYREAKLLWGQGISTQ